MGLQQTLDINVTHQYSHLGETLLRLTYDPMGVQLTGTLDVCDSCAQSKAKSFAERKKTYTQRKIQGRVFLWTQLVHYHKL